MLRYEIYKLQHPAAVVVTSIQWENTNEASGTWGTTPNLGNIKLTYSNGTTATKAYSDSRVSLYTNADCTQAFSNANPGTFTIWAKYDNKITTNSKPVKLGKKNLTISKKSTDTPIADGSTGNIIFTTNASATITLKTTSGTGWTAKLTSNPGTSHTIQVTNTTTVSSAGSIAADAIKVTVVATDTTKYNNITTDTGVNDKITLSSQETTYKWYVGTTQPAAVDNPSTWRTSNKDAGFTETVSIGTGYTWFAYPDTWNYSAVDKNGNMFLFNAFVNNETKTSIPGYTLLKGPNMAAGDNIAITFSK